MASPFAKSKHKEMFEALESIMRAQMNAFTVTIDTAYAPRAIWKIGDFICTQLKNAEDVAEIFFDPHTLGDSKIVPVWSSLSKFHQASNVLAFDATPIPPEFEQLMALYDPALRRKRRKWTKALPPKAALAAASPAKAAVVPAKKSVPVKKVAAAKKAPSTKKAASAKKAAPVKRR